MGVPSIASAFAAAARGKLRHDRIALVYRGDHQVLTVTGFHSDGTPFAMVSAPFDGNPVERAGQIARDLVNTHQGSAGSAHPLGAGADGGPAVASPHVAAGLPDYTRTMKAAAKLDLPHFAIPDLRHRSTDTMSQKGSGLARLVGGLQNFDAKADALASRLEAAMSRMEQAIPTTEQIINNVEKGAVDLETVNAQYSNGQPAGNSSGSSGA